MSGIQIAITFFMVGVATTLFVVNLTLRKQLNAKKGGK